MDVDPLALAAADPIPAVLSFLRNNPIMAEEWGGPEHISGFLRAPYPHLVVSTTNGGGLSDGIYFNRPEIMLESYGDPDGTPGKAELRRLLVIAAVVVCAMPDEGVTSNRVVISNAQMSSPFMFQPDLRVTTTPAGTYTGGNISWRVTIGCSVHAVYGQN